MLPFGNAQVRPFLPGASGAAFFTLQLLPLHAITGAGTPTRNQLIIESSPLAQMNAVPQAWNGIVAGQFVTQGLIDGSGG